MVHSFDIEIAEKYGVHAAIILSNFEYWIKKNEANNKHFYDGLTWTYNSRKAFEEIFPYMTSRQIQYAIDKLIEAGIIVTGNYNPSAYDRTLWYAITKKGKCILQNCKMDETELLNGDNEIVSPIPNNKPNNKQTDIKPNNKKENIKENLFSDFSNQFSFTEKTREDLISTLNDFVEARKQAKKPMTAQAVKRLLNRLTEYAGTDGDLAIEILDTSILKGWLDIYEPKNYSNGSRTPERRPAPSPAAESDILARLAARGYKWNAERGEPKLELIRTALADEADLRYLESIGEIVKA